MGLSIYPALIKIIKIQCIILLILSAVVAFVYHLPTGISFFIGGLISIIPGFLFGQIFLKRTGAREAKEVMNAFYSGEAVKLVATVLLFFLAFQWHGIVAVALFIGFIITQLLYWIFLFKANPY